MSCPAVYNAQTNEYVVVIDEKVSVEGLTEHVGNKTWFEWDVLGSEAVRSWCEELPHHDADRFPITARPSAFFCFCFFFLMNNERNIILLLLM